jgi:branched-chain amino acid transport system permease protein
MDAGGPAPASTAFSRHGASARRQLHEQATGGANVFLLEQVVNGLVLGGYYLLIALGLSLIFSVGGIINLAHGAFFALGAYASIEFAKFLGFGPSVVVSPVAVGLLGILFERFLLRRFYAADPILSLLVTFGLAMVVEQLIRIIWGASPIPVSLPAAFKGAVILGDFWFSRYRLFLLGVVVLVLVSIWLLLHKASFGRVIRAGIQKPDMVAALGIRLQPYMTAIVALGVGIAALAGALFAPITIVQPAMGADVITVAFVVVVIGGLGSFWGVVIAALLVGVVRGITINFIPAAGEASMYVLMFLVLLFRPRGLLGERIEKFE